MKKKQAASRSASGVSGSGEPKMKPGRKAEGAKPARKTGSQLLSLLQATLESTADGILVVDRAGHVIDYNQMFVQLWRIPADLATQRNDSLLIDFVLRQLKDPDNFLDKVRKLYDNPGNSSFDVLDFKDGRVFERYSRPQLIDGKPVGRVWSFRDVTRQKKTEQALRDTAHELQTIFNATREGILGADARTKRFVFVNTEMCRMTGYSESELLEMSVDDLHPAKDLPFLLEQFASMAQRAIEALGDVPVQRKDGSVFWCDLTSSLIERGGRKTVLALFHDTTARRKSEEALRNSEYWLRESQRVSRVGNYVLDVQSGIWTSSDVLDELFGIDTGYQRTVENWANIVHPEDRKDMLDYFMVEVLQKHNFFNREYRIVRKDDGNVRWVLGRGKLFFDRQGHPVTMAGTIQDITDSKQSELERLRFEAQAMQNQKLESLGLLAGGIAHDFNNMLMVILGSADLASQDLPASDPARLRIEGITQVARRAADLCSQLMAYAGKGQFVIKPTNLSSLVEDMRPILQVAVSRRTTISTELAGDIPAVEADVVQIRQVVMNMVINASEAIGDRNGTITISTGSTTCGHDDVLDPNLHGILKEGPYVYLKVVDTGCGMEAGTLERIFDPFFTTKLTGRGLGMATVLGIMRGHNGAVRISSETGKGTSFTALFPTSTRQAEAIVPASPVAVAESSWRGYGVVLLVDDEDTVLSVCRLMLEKVGFEVLTALNGRSAVELFGQHHAVIRCAILDLTMPEMDGEQTLDEIRRINPKIPVLMSSGYDEQSVSERLKDKGISGFIQKPYQMARLKNAMKDTLG
ncbi:MAG: PAS domain S-box protein [bacterium]